MRCLPFPKPALWAANNVRFDDEVTRNIFIATFTIPYARSWQHDNSRWDLLDASVRACYALRPEEFQLAGTTTAPPSCLEHLTCANGSNTATRMMRWRMSTPLLRWRNW